MPQSECGVCGISSSNVHSRQSVRPWGCNQDQNSIGLITQQFITWSRSAYRSRLSCILGSADSSTAPTRLPSRKTFEVYEPHQTHGFRHTRPWTTPRRSVRQRRAHAVCAFDDRPQSVMNVYRHLACRMKGDQVGLKTFWYKDHLCSNAMWAPT